MHTLKLYGPPGTGKTYSGVRWLEKQIERGLDGYSCAFVSFTNAACDVAKDRVSNLLNCFPADLEYCATLHALCKRALGITGKDWNADKRLKEFARDYDYDLVPQRGRGDEEDLDEAQASGGWDAPLMNVWNFGRNRLITDPAAAWEAYCAYDDEAEARLDFNRYLELVKDYEGWKRANFLHDFTDLLLQAVEKQISLPVSIAVIDEAQDQTPLLWAAADTLFRYAEVSAILADDDQAVYSFQGAEPRLFNERNAEKVVLLSQSHRLSEAVTSLALRVISRNHSRMEKRIEPVTAEILNGRGRPWDESDLRGECRRADTLSSLPLNNGESWYVLVRNWRFVAEVVSDLESLGYPYHVAAERYYSPWQEKGPLRAVKAVCALGEGREIEMPEVLTLVDKARTETKQAAGAWRYGAKAKLKQIATAEPDARMGLRELFGLGLTEWGVRAIVSRDLSVLEGGISARDREAYENAQRRGTFGKAPWITVSTIHGVKGGEADNVAAIAACTTAPAKNLEHPERCEEENRLGYVAVSRARKRFFAVDGVSGNDYPVFGL